MKQLQKLSVTPESWSERQGSGSATLVGYSLSSPVKLMRGLINHPWTPTIASNVYYINSHTKRRKNRTVLRTQMTWSWLVLVRRILITVLNWRRQPSLQSNTRYITHNWNSRKGGQCGRGSSRGAVNSEAWRWRFSSAEDSRMVVSPSNKDHSKENILNIKNVVFLW